MNTLRIASFAFALTLLPATQLGCGGGDEKSPVAPGTSGKPESGSTPSPGQEVLVGTLWVSEAKDNCAYALHFDTDIGYRFAFVCDKEPGVRYVEEVTALYRKDGKAIVGDLASSTCMLPPLYAHRFEREGDAFVLEIKEGETVRLTRFESSGSSEKSGSEREQKRGCLSQDGSFTPTTQTYPL